MTSGEGFKRLRPTGVEPIDATAILDSNLCDSEKNGGAKMGAIQEKHALPTDGIEILAEQLAQLSQAERLALVAVLLSGSSPS